LLCIIVFGLIACSNEKQKDNAVQFVFETSLGDITVEVYPDKAPKTVNYFLGLVDKGVYNNITFYRAMNHANTPMFVADDGKTSEIRIIHGGVGSSKAQELPAVEHETTQDTGLRHVDGTISLSHPPTNSEFWITIGENPGADFGNELQPKGYAAFGQVVNGMKVVHKINNQPTIGSVSPVGTIPETLAMTEIRKMQISDWENWMKPQQLIEPIKIIKTYRLRMEEH
jgi:peptidyl-prolyl cis-trans isomerase A (cyclophilin A)